MQNAPPEAKANEVKSAMTKGLNKLIFAKMNIQDILKKKKQGNL